MKVLLWLHACLVVYLRRLAAMDGRMRSMLFGMCAAVVLASFLGPAATLVLLVVSFLILPLLNERVKHDIDKEYADSQVIYNNSRKV